MLVARTKRKTVFFPNRRPLAPRSPGHSDPEPSARMIANCCASLFPRSTPGPAGQSGTTSAPPSRRRENARADARRKDARPAMGESHKRQLLMRVKVRRGRSEDQIDPVALAHAQIVFHRSRIIIQIFLAIELNRVYKNARDDEIVLTSRCASNTLAWPRCRAPIVGTSPIEFSRSRVSSSRNFPISATTSGTHFSTFWETGPRARLPKMLSPRPK